MADTFRTKSALLALLADNTAGDISAQDFRDVLVSLINVRRPRAITATATLDGDDNIILADATSGAITVNLPAAASYPNQTYTVVKTDASGNAVTLDGNASETINGATTHALASQYNRVSIVSNGTAWIITSA
jgi:hypothetical protein